MRAISGSIRTLSAPDAELLAGSGEWLALLVSPANLLSVVVLLTLVGAFALAATGTDPSRARQPRRAVANDGRRMEVVVLNLNGFTDVEMARLADLRRRYRQRRRTGPRRR